MCNFNPKQHAYVIVLLQLILLRSLEKTIPISIHLQGDFHVMTQYDQLYP